MVLAYLLLVFLGRPKEVWSALALAALVILSLAPLRLFSISFQLSFMAVAALIYLVPRMVRAPREPKPDRPIPRLLARLWFRGKEWLAVSVVASLATAPLVSAYFQVVSILGVLVNLVAIPLVLVLALPLGEAAVLVQAAGLTPVAQGLLFVGKLPLWLGYQVIHWGARVPGSAIVMLTPTWVEIVAYYLILLLAFAPRRTYLTWAGAGVAGIVLLTAAALPLASVPQVLEVTCLDAFGGLKAVIVSPDNRRLVLSAMAPTWPGQSTPGWGPLPQYCHWRQFRRLDLVAALNLSEAGAGELLTLARQFKVGAFWYGRPGQEGPNYWKFWNYLGDRGAVPRSLAQDRPLGALGRAGLTYVKLAPPALEVTFQGRQVLLIPPAADLTAADLPTARGLEVLVLPAKLAAPRERQLIMACLHPERLVIYGDPHRSGAARASCPIPCQFTREGAVSLYLAASGVTARQWRPNF
jgi:competence protein ComEC